MIHIYIYHLIAMDNCPFSSMMFDDLSFESCVFPWQTVRFPNDVPIPHPLGVTATGPISICGHPLLKYLAESLFAGKFQLVISSLQPVKRGSRLRSLAKSLNTKFPSPYQQNHFKISSSQIMTILGNCFLSYHNFVVYQNHLSLT